MNSAVFTCGHPRRGENVMSFKNGSYRGERCRKCHKEYQNKRSNAGRRAVELVIDLHLQGILSEGQVATALGLDRIEIREIADGRKLVRAA